MATGDNERLVSPTGLQREIAGGAVRVVDASWYLPAQARDAHAEYLEAHIPGAVFFDHDRVVDAASPMPHALPTPEAFATALGALGVGHGDRIVVYDGVGLFSTARLWWMLGIFGARDVRILDGGLPAWRDAGLPLETGEVTPAPTVFSPTFDAAGVARLDEMRAIVDSGSMQIADARSRERFEGAAPEPRAGVRAGHMPGARSLPFSELQAEGRLKDAAGLRAAFAAAGINPDKPVVTSCGSGVTAAVVSLALESLGNRTSRLYDGSWTEWGSQDDTPVLTGPARNEV